MSSDKPAMYGGTPAKTKPFPQWPTFDSRETEAVNRVLESGRWWRAVGDEVQSFEKEFAEYQSAKAALAVTNGTQALEVMLSSLGIGDGHEVILPAFTFISTASAILYINAVPILVDIDPHTYCLDPAALESAITPRTKAIVAVHMAGHSADMDAILAVARKHNIPVVEDAAHAQGAEWKGRRVGSFDRGSIFSFQAGKLMTAGEGGLILSNDEELIERCHLVANCGRPPGDRAYLHQTLGTNCRLSELQGAVLRAQLSRLDEQIERREMLAPILDQKLAQIPGIVPQGREPAVTRNPHYMYMFRYDPAQFHGLDRQTFVDALIAEGIPAFVAYLAIHRTPMFERRDFGPRWQADDARLPDYRKVHCPHAEDIGDNAVWLHHAVLLGDEEDLAELAYAIERIQSYTRVQVA